MTKVTGRLALRLWPGEEMICHLIYRQDSPMLSVVTDLRNVCKEELKAHVRLRDLEI